MSGIYPLRYRPCPRNSRISIRLFLLFSFFLLFFQLSLSLSPPSSLAVSPFFLSLFFIRSPSPQRGSKVRSLTVRRCSRSYVSTFQIFQIQELPSVDRRRDPKLACFLPFYNPSFFYSRPGYARLRFTFFSLSLSRGVSRRRAGALFPRAVRIFSLSMNNKRPIIFRSPRHLLSIRSPNVRLALNLGEMLNETFFMLKNIFNYACRTG